MEQQAPKPSPVELLPDVCVAWKCHTLLIPLNLPSGSSSCDTKLVGFYEVIQEREEGIRFIDGLEGERVGEEEERRRRRREGGDGGGGEKEEVKRRKRWRKRRRRQWREGAPRGDGGGGGGGEKEEVEERRRRWRWRRRTRRREEDVEMQDEEEEIMRRRLEGTKKKVISQNKARMGCFGKRLFQEILASRVFRPLGTSTGQRREPPARWCPLIEDEKQGSFAVYMYVFVSAANRT